VRRFSRSCRAAADRYEPPARGDLERGARISTGPLFRQALLPLQRTQMRSPAQVLSNTV
jgi:hypothetical protein